MTNDPNYLLRQANIMLARIGAYREGSETLNELAQDLDGLRAAVSDLGPAWHERFQKAWATLEHVNAILLDEGRHGPTDVERLLLDRALSELEGLANALAD